MTTKLRIYCDCALEREAVVTKISRVQSIGDIGPKHLEALDKAQASADWQRRNYVGRSRRQCLSSDSWSVRRHIEG